MKLNEEFDELFRLAEYIGYRDAQVEEFIAHILHIVNDVIRQGINEKTRRTNDEV